MKTAGARCLDLLWCRLETPCPANVILKLTNSWISADDKPRAICCAAALVSRLESEAVSCRGLSVSLRLPVPVRPETRDCSRLAEKKSEDRHRTYVAEVTKWL